jgi:hypothetical protein
MAAAEQRNAYGAAYLHTLLQPQAPPVPLPLLTLPTLILPGVPPQAEIDRQLSLYETYVQGASMPPPAGTGDEAVTLAVGEATSPVEVRA